VDLEFRVSEGNTPCKSETEEGQCGDYPRSGQKVTSTMSTSICMEKRSSSAASCFTSKQKAYLESSNGCKLQLDTLGTGISNAGNRLLE